MSHDPNDLKAAAEAAEKAASAVSAPEKPRIRFLDLLGGLPALLAAAGLLGGLAWEGRREKLLKSYEAEAGARIKQNDLHGALILLKRLVSMSDKPDYRFGLVLVYERSGDLARAEFLARTLAPLDDRRPDEVEYQPARFWLARRLVMASGRSRQRIAEAEKHLQRLLKANPNERAIKMVMADYYFLNGRAREARPFLEAVAQDNPDYLLKLAGVCAILGDKEEAARRANQVIAIAKPALEKEPKNLAARIQWSNALLVQEDFPGAIEVLKAADGPPEAEPILKGMIAMDHGAWADALAKQKASTSDRLATLVRGLEYDPTSTALQTRVADLLNSEGEDYKQVVAVINKMLDAGQSPGLLHFALGNDHWARGRLPEARAEWTKAVEANPPMPLAANNLAWSLAYHEPLDLPRALSLIEGAAAALPNNLQIRGTHGQVLVKLGRWEEAVPKLEEALRGGQGSAGIHRSLADAYENMNKPVLANEHRRIANELAAAAPPSSTPSTQGDPRPAAPATRASGDPRPGSG